jgi:hypothetical protein
MAFIDFRGSSSTAWYSLCINLNHTWAADFFQGGPGGVKFVDPILMDNFFQKKNQIFFSKKIQKNIFFVFFFEKK